MKQRPELDSTGLKVGYRKFHRTDLRILILDRGLPREVHCRRELEKAGHQVVSARLPQAQECVIPFVVGHINRLQPDFIFSINNTGFAKNAELIQLCDKSKLPVAIWYTGAPWVPRETSSKISHNWATAFTQERAQLPYLSSFYSDTHYLPLATHLGVDMPNFSPQSSQLSYVGSSGERGLEESLKEIPLADHSLIVRFSGDIIHQPELLCEIDVAPDWMPSATRKNLDAMVLAASSLANIQNRNLFLEPLISYGLRIFGDPGWLEQFQNKNCFAGPAPQTNALSDHYANSKFNLWISPANRCTSLSQQVFDIMGSGGFLLTNHQGDFPLLFASHNSPVTFTSPAQLEELVVFYESRPSLMKQIAKKNHSVITSNHLYYHRMRDLTQAMRDHYS